MFQSPRKLRHLERIVHPRVARLQARLARTISERQPNAVVIYEVPLLFEAGVDKRVDEIIVVTADRRTQMKRLAQRTSLPRAEILRRIKSQMPLARKRRMAGIVLDGTMPLPTLSRMVVRLYRQLEKRADPSLSKPANGSRITA